MTRHGGLPVRRRCVVTGAGSGIGAAIAARFVRDGAAVAALDVRKPGLERLASDLDAAGFDPPAIATCDVGDRSSFQATINAVTASLGGLDVLVNAAGVAPVGALMDITEADFTRTMLTNAFSVVSGTQAARELMDGADGGRIINVCSIAGVRASPGSAVYSASKFAVRALTQSFALELAGTGITVNAICPGYVDTPIWERIADGDAVEAKKLRDTAAGRVPLGRLGLPEEIAGAVAFLASTDAGYVTGQCLVVDGGVVPH